MVPRIAGKRSIAVLVWWVVLPPVFLRCLQHVAFVRNLRDKRNDLLLLLLEGALSGEPGVLEHGLLKGLEGVLLCRGEESVEKRRVDDAGYICCCVGKDTVEDKEGKHCGLFVAEGVGEVVCVVAWGRVGGVNSDENEDEDEDEDWMGRGL